MNRPDSPLAAVVAAATLVVYVALATLTYRALGTLWALQSDPLTTAALVVGLAFAFGYASYRFGTVRIRLALDAVELPRSEVPQLYRRVDDLSDRIGVDSPRLLVASMGQPNALALGGVSNGEVIVDGSLFRLLTAAELEAILAHELAHLKRRDSLVKTLAFSLVRTVTGAVWVALLPLTLLVGGVARSLSLLRGDDPVTLRGTARAADTAATGLVVVCLFALTAVVQAYSRRQEYGADETAARVTGQPLALASALAKIDRATAPDGLLSPLLVHGDAEGSFTDLLASHPPMADRIDRLRRRPATDDAGHD